MQRTQEIVRAELLIMESEFAAAMKSCARFRQMDILQNEGGEGYRHEETRREITYDDYAPRVYALRDELFALEWTKEVTQARRATWNGEVANCVAFKDVLALESREGYTLADLKRAIARHAT